MRHKKWLYSLGFLGVSSLGHTQNTLQYLSKESIYRNGLELFENKGFATSRKEFDHYLTYTPESELSPNLFNQANALYFAAVAALKTEAPDAQIQVERFIKNNPDHPKAKIIYVDLADDLFASQKFDQAIPFYEKALKNRLSNLETYDIRYRLGISYFMVKNYGPALIAFNEVKRTASASAVHAAYYAAVIAFEQQDYESALEDLRRVENVNPYKLEVPNWIADILYKQKKFDELIAYTEPIIQTPNGRKIDEIALVTAEVFFFKNNFSKSAYYYDKYKTLRRGTTSPQITFRHAYALYQVEKYAEAAKLFKTIATGTSDLGQQAAYYLGISALKSQSILEAKAAFDVARKAKFDTQIQEESAYNLVKIHLDAKENAEAIQQLQNYLKEYPTGKYVDESNELLSEIFFETSNYTAAIQYIESLNRRTSKINQAYQKLTYNQAVLDFNAERYAQSMTLLDKSLSQGLDALIAWQARFLKAEAAHALKLPETATLYGALLGASVPSTFRLKSLYSLGYWHFNRKEYPQALRYFSDFRAQGKDQGALFEDALLRLSDCYLVQKRFNEALEGYRLAASQHKSDRDYALFYQAVTLQYMDRDAEAQRLLDEFIRKFPQSRLVDDALYRTGVLAMDKGNYQQAITVFTDMLRQKPASPLVPTALLRRATSFNNLQNYDRAISDYRLVVEKFPKSDAAEEALIGLRDAYTLSGRTEEFSTILDGYAKANPANQSLNALQFETAKNLVYAEKYQQAIPALEKYIRENPSSGDRSEAYYLLGEAFLMTQAVGKARASYQLVPPESSFYARAAYRIGKSYFAEKNYQEAYDAYGRVIANTTNKRELVTAQVDRMIAAFELNLVSEVKRIAQDILSDGGQVVLGADSQARLYLGRTALKEGKFETAQVEFKSVESSANDVFRAEAIYWQATSLFMQKKYDASIALIQEKSNSYAEFGDWYDRTILLNVDNYLGKDDSFMAKAILNSIIDNSPNAATVDAAKSKLSTIK